MDALLLYAHFQLEGDRVAWTAAFRFSAVKKINNSNLLF
jgi:hypothetical protein